MRTPKLLAAAALLVPTLALASGYAVPDVNPRDLAMADSVVAAQRDAAATMKNPAALSRLDGLNLDLALTVINSDNAWTAPGGTASNATLFRPTPTPVAFAAYGTRLLDRRVGVGLGMMVPFGGHNFWPDNWGNLPDFPSAGAYRILTVDRRVYAVYLTAGVELLPGVRIGGGPIYYRTTEYLKQKASYAPISTTPGVAEIGTAGDAFSYDVAAEVDVPGLPLTLGIDYKHKASATLKGRAHFTDVPTALEPTLADQDARHPLTIPNLLSAGLAYRATKTLLLTFSYTLDRWVVYGEDVFSGTIGSPPLVITVPRNYRSASLFRFGVEWQVTDRLELRGGLHRDTSGYRSSTISPTLPDSSNTVLAAGASYAFTPRFALNGAFFHAFYDKVTATGSAAFPGTYDPKADILSIGFTWRL